MTSRELIDLALHPACQAKRRRPHEFALIAAALLFAFVSLSLLVPTAWWLLVAPVVGSVVVTHPVCLITHYHHKARSHR